MQTRLLSSSGGANTYYHDHGDGNVTLQTVADVTQAVERAKALHNEGRHATGMGDKHAASIPIPVLTGWLQERGKTFADWCAEPRLVREFLQDPANSVFRVWKGRV